MIVSILADVASPFNHVVRITAHHHPSPIICMYGTPGTMGAPASHCGNTGGGPFVTVPTTPTIAEKPYMTVAPNGKYTLAVPPLRSESIGPDWDDSKATKIGFESIYVAVPEESAATINAKLAEGLHVLLSPGIYNLTEALQVCLSSSDGRFALLVH